MQHNKQNQLCYIALVGSSRQLLDFGLVYNINSRLFSRNLFWFSSTSFWVSPSFALLVASSMSKLCSPVRHRKTLDRIHTKDLTVHKDLKHLIAASPCLWFLLVFPYRRHTPMFVAAHPLCSTANSACICLSSNCTSLQNTAQFRILYNSGTREDPDTD